MTKMKSSYFKCMRASCFGNADGKCTILETRCKREPCPFYKELEKIQKQEVGIFGKELHADRNEMMGC